MVRGNFKFAYSQRKRLANGSIKVFWYYRPNRSQPGIPLLGSPGSPEFIASYATAQRLWTDAPNAKPVEVLSAMFDQFLDSSGCAKLAARTLRDYRHHLRAFGSRFGTMPLEIFKDRADSKKARGIFLSYHDKLSKLTPKKADYVMTVVARAFAWAEDRGLIEDHPLLAWGRAYKADRSDKIWTPADVEAFLTTASPEMTLALLLALYTGQRQGDLLRLTWLNYRSGTLYLKQSKGQRRVQVPCIGQLRSMLDALRDSRERTSTHILVSPQGRPWKTRRFSFVFKRTCERARVSGLTFHDLRGTAVTTLADAGCTEAEIVAITGHSNRSAAEILERYTSRTPAQGRAAMEKLENHLRTNFSNQNSNRDENGGSSAQGAA